MYTQQTFLGKTFEKGHLFQMDIEDNIPLILKKPKNELVTVVVVGAWHGDEIQSFLNYGNVHVWAFEPNPGNFAYLKQRYKGNPYVTCFPYACGESNTTLPLYEGSIEGNDSLLPIKDSPRMKATEVHTVEVKRLDSFDELKNIPIDLIWIDAQGYELPILRGAESILPHVKSMFLEVNEDDRTYVGTTLLSELEDYLDKVGFYNAHREIDDRDKTGNAFYLNKKTTTDFFSSKDEVSKRNAHSLERRKSSIMISDSVIYRASTKLIPVGMRATIKKLLGI